MRILSPTFVVAVVIAVATSGAAADAGVPPPPPVNDASTPPLPDVSPSPSPSPTVSPDVVPLHVATSRTIVAVGATSSLAIVGGIAPFVARADEAIATVALDASGATVVVRARALGTTTLEIVDATGARATATIVVAPAAGFVPSDVSLALTGRPSHDELVAQTIAALGRASHPLPGARVTVGDAFDVAALAPNTSSDVPVAVTLDGVNRYANVTGTATVHLTVGGARADVPTALFYSDDPERVESDGVLFHDVASVARPVRLYYYHLAATAGRRVAVVLDAPTGDALANVVGSGAGPNPAVMFVGQSATQRYLDARARASGVDLAIPVGGAVAIDAGGPLAAGDLVAGVLDVTVVSGDSVRVSVVSYPQDGDPRVYLGADELASDGKQRRGTYDIATPEPLDLAYRVGDPESPPIAVGDRASALPNQRPGGHSLAGDYGIVHPVTLRLANPSNVVATAYLYEAPIGSPVTTTIAFDGDDAPTRIGCVRTKGNRYLVRAFALAPGASQTVAASYMTDGGSTYPLAFGVTAAPPLAPALAMSAPDGCFPKPGAS